MGVKAELHRDGRVVVQFYSDPLDMKDIIAQQQWIQSEIMANASKRVHTIIDTREVTRIPNNLISQGVQSVKVNHPMGGEIVLVSNSAFISTVAGIFKRVARNYTVNVFKTMEEAWEYIERVLTKEDAH